MRRSREESDRVMEASNVRRRHRPEAAANRVPRGPQPKRVASDADRKGAGRRRRSKRKAASLIWDRVGFALWRRRRERLPFFDDVDDAQ